MTQVLHLGVADVTDAELHVYADGTLGNDSNDGRQRSMGTGGSFSFSAGTVMFAGTWKIGISQLTGALGNLSTDGSTEKSTWLAIDSGTSVSDTAEMTMAKKVS